MKDQYSRRDFLKTSAAAGLTAGLVNLTDTSEAEAHPPAYFGRPVYFGRHPRHQFGIYGRARGGPALNGFLVQDAALWAMFWGDAIRRQGIEDRRIRTSPNFNRRTYNPLDCRVEVQKPQHLPQTFVAYCYEDLCMDDTPGNKRWHFPEEFPGLDQKKYDLNKPLTLGFRLPIPGVKGKTVETRLYMRVNDEQRYLVGDKKRQVVPGDHRIMTRTFPAEWIGNFYGTGDYEAEFYFGDPDNLKHWNTHKFKIVHEVPKTGAIAEPNGVVGSRAIPDPEVDRITKRVKEGN